MPLFVNFVSSNTIILNTKLLSSVFSTKTSGSIQFYGHDRHHKDAGVNRIYRNDIYACEFFSTPFSIYDEPISSISQINAVGLCPKSQISHNTFISASSLIMNRWLLCRVSFLNCFQLFETKLPLEDSWKFSSVHSTLFFWHSPQTNNISTY